MRQLVLEKENSEFKPVKLRLKIYLVSYPARAEGLGKYDMIKSITCEVDLLSFGLVNNCHLIDIRTLSVVGKNFYFSLISEMLLGL